MEKNTAKLIYLISKTFYENLVENIYVHNILFQKSGTFSELKINPFDIGTLIKYCVQGNVASVRVLVFTATHPTPNKEIKEITQNQTHLSCKNISVLHSKQEAFKIKYSIKLENDKTGFSVDEELLCHAKTK